MRKQDYQALECPHPTGGGKSVVQSSLGLCRIRARWPNISRLETVAPRSSIRLLACPFPAAKLKPAAAIEIHTPLGFEPGTQRGAPTPARLTPQSTADSIRWR